MFLSRLVGNLGFPFLAWKQKWNAAYVVTGKHQCSCSSFFPHYIPQWALCHKVRALQPAVGGSRMSWGFWCSVFLLDSSWPYAIFCLSDFTSEITYSTWLCLGYPKVWCQGVVQTVCPPHFKTLHFFSLQHYASRNGHYEVCQFLLENKAIPNTQTNGGATPLHRASYCGHMDIARLLLSHGANPAVMDDDGRTCLHKVCPPESSFGPCIWVWQGTAN